MKKIFAIILALLSVTGFAQTKNSAKISGNIISLANDSVSLDNYYHKVVKIPVDKSGAFSSVVKLDSGAYYNLNGLAIYLEPKMDLVINKDSVYTFAGKGITENDLMKQVATLVNKNSPAKYNELFNKPVDTEPADYIKQMDDYKATVSKLLADTKGLSKYFIKTQQDNAEYITRLKYRSYLLDYGKDPEVDKQIRDLISHSTKENQAETTTKMLALSAKWYAKRMPPADRNLLEAKMWEGFDVNNRELFKFSQAYKTLLDARVDLLLNAELTKSPYLRAKDRYELKFDVINKEITDSYVKQGLLYGIMRLLIKPNPNLEANYTKYLAVATDQFYKTEATAAYNRIKLYAKGGQTPLFVFNDTNDKPVALADLLKGNYVYIDIWATWCGPCISEIPSLKKIEEKYHDKPIKFVSISIDAKKDINKWKNFVKDRELGGVQVYAGTNSAFVKNYNVPFIPRFILIAPDGKIVAEDADRPSNPKLQEQLDKLLNSTP
jgi:thiol-disulfide isomerase/thioredoxin